MTPRRLIRWKSFWLGILVLGFLAFGWVRSKAHSDNIHCVTPRSLTIINVAIYGGVITWQRTPSGELPSMDPWKPTFEVNSYLSEAEPPERGLTLKGDGYGGEVATIPHWFLMLLFLVPWLGFLLWRVRSC